MKKYYEYQYFAPGLEAGLVEISLSKGLQADKKHVKSLLRIKLRRQRLPSGTLIFPYYSLGGALLRERAREEAVRVDDRMQTNQGMRQCPKTP